MKFSPFSGVPAATELLTARGAEACVTFLLMGRSELSGEGDKGVEKGCAAPVLVAAEGVCEEEELPERGAACVAAFGETAA